MTRDAHDDAALELISKTIGYNTLNDLMDGAGPDFHEVLGEHDGLWEDLYNLYCNAGEMPYGTAKARTGCPDEWITNRLEGIFA